MKKDKLNHKLNKEDLCFIIYETMKRIAISEFKIDKIIEIPYIREENKIDLSSEITIFNQEKFAKNNLSSKEKAVPSHFLYLNPPITFSKDFLVLT